MATITETDLKPQFKEVGVLYEAVVAANLPMARLNRDTADTLMRELSRTPWKGLNERVYHLWNAGGDEWHQLIKDVKSYSNELNQRRRTLVKEAKKSSLLAAQKNKDISIK
jgi:hypothetical protein